MKQGTICTLLLIIAFSATSHASRKVRSMPVNMLGRFYYTRDREGNSLPDGPSTKTFGDPQRIGAHIIFEIDIVNLSDKATTGSVSLKLNADATDDEDEDSNPGRSVFVRATCSKQGVTNGVDSRLYLCGGSDGSKVTADFKGNTAIPPVPEDIKFRLPGDSSTRMSVHLVSNATFGDADKGGCKTIWAYLTASIQITIDDDRGAVAASVTPRLGNASPSVKKKQTFQICGVGPVFQTMFSGDYNDAPLSPVLFNGGRPF